MTDRSGRAAEERAERPPSLPRQCHECLVNSDVIQNLAKLALARVLGNIFGHKEEDQIGDLANYCVAKAVDVPWTCPLMMFDLEEQTCGMCPSS